MADSPQPDPKPGVEKTRRQGGMVGGYGPIGQLHDEAPACFATYRKIRRHPTVALARAFAMAPIIAGSWSIETRDDAPSGAEELINAQIMPLRRRLVTDALRGCMDFGFAAWEIVYRVTKDGIGIAKLKPLLQDITTILVERASGRFAGLRQPAQDFANEVTIDPLYCLLISRGQEGCDYYGEPTLETVRDRWNEWNDASRGAGLYDRKVAGAHPIVKYPPGETEVEPGVMQSNYSIAFGILKEMMASGGGVLPSSGKARMDGSNIDEDGGWSVEFLADPSPRQGAFVERMKYLDTLMARGVLIPERAVFEGQFGTKAEADSHADIAVTCRDVEHQELVETINWHLVDKLLAANYGEEARGSVWLAAAPLVDAQIAFWRDIYKQLLANPTVLLDELRNLDRDAIRDGLGLPANENPEEDPPLEDPIDPPGDPNEDPSNRPAGEAA